MNKKILLGLGALSTLAVPIAAVISCNNGSSIHVISKKTEDKLNELFKQKDTFIDLVAGRPIIPQEDEFYLQMEVDKFTSHVVVSQVNVYESDLDGSNRRQVLVGDDVIASKKYYVEVTYAPKKGSRWETGTEKEDPKIFKGVGHESVQPTKDLDINDFQSLKFKNIDDILKKGITLGELVVDDENKPWKGKVKFYLASFQEKGMRSGDTYATATRDYWISPGHYIKGFVIIEPQGVHAWKTGDNFKPKEVYTVEQKVQIKYDIKDFFVGYKNLLEKKINMNLFYGFISKTEDPALREGWVELYQYTSQTDAKVDPATLSYTKVDWDEPNIYNPDPGTYHMNHEQKVVLPDEDKYVNFKLVYKNFFKKDASIPYILYDQDYVASNTPYDKSTPEHMKIIQDGDDLVVYTYSLPYNIY